MGLPRRVEAFRERLGIELPIWQAPMAGAQGSALAIAVARGGGLGALPSARVSLDAFVAEIEAFRAATPAPLNLNFFCHVPPVPDPAREAAWRARLQPYYAELGVSPPGSSGPGRAPFDEGWCAVVEATIPEVVSFHFGLPERTLLARVKATGALVVSSATTVAEGRVLAARGVDAIIAQGLEAGGHRGTFLSGGDGLTTMALVPLLCDAVDVPIVAAGGIADGRGVAAALALGASAVQIGTAYLHCPEATLSDAHRAALAAARADPASVETALTNLFSGRPARGIVNRLMRELGAMGDVPAFPLAGGALAPLTAVRPGDFGPLWAGQAVSLGREQPADALTRSLAAQAEAIFALVG